MSFARAILWAQWKTLSNFYPRRGVAWSAGVGFLWYGIWIALATAMARIFSEPESINVIRLSLSGGLLLMLLYWQVVPLLLATTGASLDLKKLRAYPIPAGQMFFVEVLLRITSGVEVILVLTGITIGTLFNPALPKWSLLAAPVYILFNLYLAVGMRDLLGRLLARKRIRELVFFLAVLCAARPQLFLSRRSGAMLPQLRFLVAGDSWPWSPWTAAGQLMQGLQVPRSLALLIAWTVAVALFSRWQFHRTLAFDADSVNTFTTKNNGRRGPMESFYRLPSALLPDPLGALIEKEMRFLLRSPRFRLVFLMGFTFGLVIWLPMVFAPSGPLGGFFRQNYLTVVSIYSLMLMSEVCFWNAFGFDRTAAQFYFLAPVSFAQVLAGKNLTALFFLMLELATVTGVCLALRMPLDGRRLAEAYGVAAVVMILLFAAGNQLSVRQAHGVNPANSLRTGTAGRLQAMLFVVYPATFAPVALAYLARYAFDSQWALYGVLALDAAAGLVLYRVSLDSAVIAAERIKEQMVAALSVGDGPIAD